MEGLIEIENPNRVAQKSKKVTQIELDEPKQLSRRERCVSVSHIMSLIHFILTETTDIAHLQLYGAVWTTAVLLCCLVYYVQF